MGMVIGQSNSLRFRKVDSNPPNFDNTLVADEIFYNDKIWTYCQRWKTTDTAVTVQVNSDSDTLPTVVATKADNSTVNITPTGSTYVSRYDTTGDGSFDLWFFAFDIDMSVYTTETFVTVTQGAVVYKSEPFKGDANLATEIANGEVQVIDYFNVDNTFEIDFSSGAGSITYTLYVEGSMKRRTGGGESSLYDNQQEITLLKRTKKRLLELKTLEVPRYIEETIDLITAMDNITINGVAYVYEEDSVDSEEVEGSNLVTVTVNFTDKEYLGVNTNDPGFDVDTPATGVEDMIFTEEGASGGDTFTIPAGYLVHTLRAQWVSGASVTVKLGTSVGTDELVFPFVITTSNRNITVSIHMDINRDSDTDIYSTVSGGVANIDIRADQNKQIP